MNRKPLVLGIGAAAVLAALFALDTATPAGQSARAMLGLALVLGLAVGLGHLARRFGGAQARVAQAGAPRVVGAVGVGPKERVVVVEVDGQRLVLGVAPGCVVALHALPRIPGVTAANDEAVAHRDTSAGDGFVEGITPLNGIVNTAPTPVASRASSTPRLPASFERFIGDLLRTRS